MEYLIIIIVALVFLNANSSKIKGNKGEKYVDSILREIPDSMVMRDIVLKSVFGTSQIDNILISPKGIFIIETKTIVVGSLEMKDLNIGLKHIFIKI